MDIKNLKRSLKNTHIINTFNGELSKGLRSNIRYCSVYLTAMMLDFNVDGIKPYDYLMFAKEDAEKNTVNGNISSLQNIKKCNHLLVERLFYMLGLENVFYKSAFPKNLDILKQLEAFPINLLTKLNSLRNKVEHKYKTVDNSTVLELLDYSEIFYRLCHNILKQMVIGLHVGLNNDDEIYFWELNFNTKEISICKNPFASKFINTRYGKLYYGFDLEATNYIDLKVVKIERNNQKDWIPLLNLFIFCTKDSLLIKNDEMPTKENIIFHSRKINFADSFENSTIELDEDNIKE